VWPFLFAKLTLDATLGPRVHLPRHHSSDLSLVPLQIPALDSPLLRCSRCHWICSGQAGLTKHQATNQSCQCLAPSSSALLISSPTVLSSPLPDESPSLSDSSSPLSPASDDRLMALFGPGLFTIHRSWGNPFFLVVERLLGIINLNRSCSAEAATLAFNILPGLVGAFFLSRKIPIPDFLISFFRNPLYESVGPAPPCVPPNNCRTSLTAISLLRLDLRLSLLPIPSTLSDPPLLRCVIPPPIKAHLLLTTYSPLSSPPLSPSLPAMYWQSSSIYLLVLLPALLDGPMPP
jgi:hypothetical protein